MIAACTSPVRSEDRCGLRDQSPTRPVVQPVVAATVTTAGPQPRSRSASPCRSGQLSATAALLQLPPQLQVHTVPPSFAECGAKRGPAARQRDGTGSFVAIQVSPKRQLLGSAAQQPPSPPPPPPAAAAAPQDDGKRQQQQQPTTQQVTAPHQLPQRDDEQMHDSCGAEAAAVGVGCLARELPHLEGLEGQGSLETPFSAVPPLASSPAATGRYSAANDNTQPQAHGDDGAAAASADNSGAAHAAAPSLLLRTPAAGAAAAYLSIPAIIGRRAAGSAGSSSPRSNSSPRSRPVSPIAVCREPSLSFDEVLAAPGSIASAGSLEGWLPSAAIAAAAAAAVAGEGPAGAAAAAAAALARSGSISSTAAAAAGADLSRQGSLAFPPQQVLAAAAAAVAAAQQHQAAVAAAAAAGGQLAQSQQGPGVLSASGCVPAQESTGSFAGWPGGNSSSTLGRTSNPAAHGSFSWPRIQPCRSDSLSLDIQVLAPVLPEEYPPGTPLDPDAYAAAYAAAVAAAAEEYGSREGLSPRAAAARERAMYAKVAAWEAELVDMLEATAAPLPIRDIVSVFKDRILSDRDKSEFKALCDKYTGVVEFPAGSGVKCLAMKSWMRQG